MRLRAKRYLALGLVVLMMLQLVTIHVFAGEEESQKSSMDYALFSGSHNSSLTINASKASITGNVHTNADFVFQGSSLVIQGICEAAGKLTLKTPKVDIAKKIEGALLIDIQDHSEGIKQIASEDAEIIEKDKSYNGNQVILEQSVIVKGNLKVNCSRITSKGYIIAEKDIAFNTSITESGSDKGIVIASEKGNITFNGSNVNIKGIVYAPKGTVIINAARFTIQGRIIADSIVFRGSSLDVQAGPDDLELIDSEKYQPSVTIDTSGFKVLDAEEAIFWVDDKVDKITGMASNITSMNMTIASGKLELANKPVTPSENWCIDIPGLIVGSNRITITATGLNGKTISQSITLVNQYEGNSTGLYLDSGDDDNDLLLNWQEDVVGTQKNNADTDGDGLTDYEEIFITLTDALSIDTDENGKSDDKEDFDDDKLNNLQECSYATNPYSNDTDCDSLTDYEEIFVYFTNPLSKDSDNDGMTDLMEIEYGMMPNNRDSLNDGVLDGDRIFMVTKTCDGWNAGDAVKPVLEIELQGKQIESLSIDKVDENDSFLNAAIPGYIGNAYDFNVDGTFQTATLTFEFDQELLNDQEFVPAIYYWDEEKQFLFEVPNQTISGNTVSASVTHFSKYMVIAKDAYNKELFRFEILPPTDDELQNKKYDLALVLDSSGSISTTNYNLIKSLSVDLVQTLGDEDRIAVFTFDSIVRKHSTFVNKEHAISVISGLPRYAGNTAIYNGIKAANDEFIANSSSDVSKVMIVLTDGQDNVSTVTPDSIIQTACDNSIIIYTVGVGSVNTEVLKNIANSTGGAYYSASDFSQLVGIFDRLQEDIDLYKDSDNDGISDYHEKKIAAGELKLGNGAPVMYYSSLNYLNPDSDADGILDGEELKIDNQYIQGIYVYYCYLSSVPCMEDSDLDSLLDNEDPTPLVKHDSRFERVYDSSFRPVNEYILELQEKSDKEYKTDNPGLNDYWIREKAYLTIAGGYIAFMPQASSALSHFIGNTGNLYTINAKKLMNQSPNAKNHLYDNLNHMLTASEAMVMDGKTIVITTNTPFVATSLSNTGADDNKEKDWWFTIGNSSSAMTATVTRNGEQYVMVINYYIDDFYDWEKGSPLKGGPLLTDGEMYRLHEVGLAKQFPVEGCYKVKVTWTRGQRFDSNTTEPTLEEARQ